MLLYSPYMGVPPWDWSPEQYNNQTTSELINLRFDQGQDTLLLLTVPFFTAEYKEVNQLICMDK